jgi:hypothetical protein
LITVRDPASGVRVLLDGNKRALELWARLSCGALEADTPVLVFIGDLDLLVVPVAKAVAPLWR